jgi:hypothetical protein
MKFMKYLNDLDNDAPEPKQGYKRCSECGNECPLSDFKRRATILQTRAWTKNPTAKKRLEYEGRTCNACHSTHRLKATDISPEVYRKKLVNQGLNPLKVQARVETRRLWGVINRKKKSSKTLLKNALPEIQPMIDEIRAIEKKLTNKMLHFKRIEQSEAEGSVFCARYMIMLESVRQQLKLKAMAKQKLPQDWHELIADRFTTTIWEMFRAVPAQHKQRLAPFMQHIPRTPEDLL